MTKSFDEWRNEQRNKVDGYTERDAYEAGQQSKQAEVDGLQLKLSEDSRVLHNVIDIERKKCEKLQKRIDDIELHTKAMIECLLSCSSPSIHMGGQLEAFMSISKILRGGQS